MSDTIAKVLPYAVDLAKPIKKTYMDTIFATEDNQAHRFDITLKRNGAAVTLDSGTSVSAYFIRYADNTTVPLTGNVSGSVVSVTLSKACYTKAGQFALIIKAATGSTVSTVLYAEGTIYTSSTDTMVDEENIIPSLSDLLAQIDAMEAATSAAKTATANANTATGKANTAATNANNAASAANTAASGASGWANATMTATALETGSAPTATVTTASDGHKVITVGIPRGNTGATPQISVQVATGAAGSEASVSVSGTAENPVIHLTIPRGNTGSIENLTINGKPVESGTITLKASDVGALASDGIAADSSKLGGKTWAERLLDIYPIGSIYMSVNSTSPASLFGGTWEQLKDRFLLGAGSTYSAGSTGGAQNVTLTMSQIPKHTIKIREATSSGENTGYRFSATSGTYSMASYLETVGGGESHNNMPPYLAVYMWKRVS